MCRGRRERRRTGHGAGRDGRRLRAPGIDVGDPSAAAGQVRWEYQNLQRADLVLFWFTEGISPQPIALYELGRLAAGSKKLVVGAHPDYIRRTDILLQLSLVRPGLVVHSDLGAAVAEAVDRIY